MSHLGSLSHGRRLCSQVSCLKCTFAQVTRGFQRSHAIDTNQNSDASVAASVMMNLVWQCFNCSLAASCLEASCAWVPSRNGLASLAMQPCALPCMTSPPYSVFPNGQGDCCTRALPPLDSLLLSYASCQYVGEKFRSHGASALLLSATTIEAGETRHDSSHSVLDIPTM